MAALFRRQIAEHAGLLKCCFESFSAQFTERDLQRPLTWPDRAQIVDCEIDAFADANACGKRAQPSGKSDLFSPPFFALLLSCYLPQLVLNAPVLSVCSRPVVGTITISHF